jgi:hypothetical protein
MEGVVMLIPEKIKCDQCGKIVDAQKIKDNSTSDVWQEICEGVKQEGINIVPILKHFCSIDCMIYYYKDKDINEEDQIGGND